MQHSKGCHLVCDSLTNGHALALATKLENEAIVNRGGRHIFLIPWRGRTLIGTTTTLVCNGVLAAEVDSGRYAANFAARVGELEFFERDGEIENRRTIVRTFLDRQKGHARTFST